MSEARSNPILHRKKMACFIILLVIVLSGFMPNLPADAGYSIGTLDTLFSLTSEEAKITRHLSEFQNNVKAAPDVLAAVAEIEESQAVMEQVQAESGFKVFGSG